MGHGHRLQTGIVVHHLELDELELDLIISERRASSLECAHLFAQAIPVELTGRRLDGRLGGDHQKKRRIVVVGFHPEHSDVGTGMNPIEASAFRPRLVPGDDLFFVPLECVHESSRTRCPFQEWPGAWVIGKGFLQEATCVWRAPVRLQARWNHPLVHATLRSQSSEASFGSSARGLGGTSFSSS